MIEWMERKAMSLVWAVLSVIAIVVGAILYFVFWEPPYLAYLGAAQIDLPRTAGQLPVVRPGDIVPLMVSRYSSDSVTRTYTTSRELACDSLKHPVPLVAVPRQIEPGITTATSKDIVIPFVVTDDDYQPTRLTPSGICHIQGAAEISGLIRVILVTWRSEDFRIVSDQ